MIASTQDVIDASNQVEIKVLVAQDVWGIDNLWAWRNAAAIIEWMQNWVRLTNWEADPQSGNLEWTNKNLNTIHARRIEVWGGGAQSSEEEAGLDYKGQR